MSEAFFQDLNMPQPAYFLGVGSGSHATQTARIITEFEKVCLEEKPDLVIVVGDVNSTIACALVSVKLGIKTAHVEAGLRSGDRSMPEEINRIATDSICDYCFVTEQSGLDNLINNGFPKGNIFFVGNTMIDSLCHALEQARSAKVWEHLGLEPKQYALMTVHRPSNVDSPEQLKELLEVFKDASIYRKLVFPVHPRTRKNIELFGLKELADSIPDLILCDPLGYIDFLSLMTEADYVLTDSGGIQEETTALGIDCLTIRTTTERPSTIELGTNKLIAPEPENIISAIRDLFQKPRKEGTCPPMWDGHAGERIAEIIDSVL
jgi:UDP-N-acetylglucosamine 2-epimerase (non-hydrolysing)